MRLTGTITISWDCDHRMCPGAMHHQCQGSPMKVFCRWNEQVTLFEAAKRVQMNADETFELVI